MQWRGTMKRVEKTQEEMVLEYLKEFGSITSWKAIFEFGISRLSAKIYNLRKLGYNIETTNITKKNRYGSWVTFAKYVLVDK